MSDTFVPDLIESIRSWRKWYLIGSQTVRQRYARSPPPLWGRFACEAPYRRPKKLGKESHPCPIMSPPDASLSALTRT